MRLILACMMLVVAAAGVGSQEPERTKPARRYGIEPRLRDFPQSTPKDALASVVSALEGRRIDYLMAQLADPAFVDERVKQQYHGNFDELVRETNVKLRDNPGMVKELQRFLKEGEWQTSENAVSVRLKDVPDRQVFLKKLDGRWFLENRQKSQDTNK